MSSDRYLIYSYTAGAWWRAGGGFTCDLTDAATYDLAEAASRVADANRHQQPGQPSEEFIAARFARSIVTTFLSDVLEQLEPLDIKGAVDSTKRAGNEDGRGEAEAK